MEEKLIKLMAIIAEANGGWSPDWKNPEEIKYVPLFCYKDGVLVLRYVYPWNLRTVVPAPFVFKSKEICEQVVEDNIELFRAVYG